MSAQRHRLSRGFLINEYRIDRVLGGGGFSLVYRAYHIRTQAKVVIKEFCPESLVRRMPGGRIVPLSDEAALTFQAGIKRFFDEASALSKVHHPNIVRVSHVFRANETVYMVMDYERGTDLRAYIKRQSKSLSQRFLEACFPPLLAGVQVMHDRDLLHLDIKPGNILLRAGGRPLLLDFGAVHMMHSQAKGAHTLTMGFAPIEQHQKGNLGPWTDVYAIGASMYACIKGRPPPPAPERADKDTMTPAARYLGLRYPRHLLGAVDQALRVHAGDRLQSAQALLEAAFPLEQDNERSWWSRTSTPQPEDE